jgi:Holliday junction DNA helicase RuvA
VALTKIPGIGKKTAERIVVELRDRVDGMLTTLPGQVRVGTVVLDASGEATVALQQLGYKPAEAAKMARDAAADGDEVASVIRKALQAALR